MDVTDQFLAIPGINRTWKFFRSVKRRFKVAKTTLVRVSSKTVNLLSTHSSDSEKEDDLEANILPVSNGHSRNPSAMASVSQLPTGSESGNGIPASVAPSVSTSAGKSPTLTNAGEPGTPAPPTRGKLLWRNALQTVKMRSVTAAPFGRMPHRQRTTSSTLTNMGDRKRTMAEEPVKAAVVARSRLATLRPKLNILTATEGLEAHQALVRHLQFSPDGKFLATSR